MSSAEEKALQEKLRGIRQSYLAEKFSTRVKRKEYDRSMKDQGLPKDIELLRQRGEYDTMQNTNYKKAVLFAKQEANPVHPIKNINRKAVRLEDTRAGKHLAEVIAATTPKVSENKSPESIASE